MKNLKLNIENKFYQNTTAEFLHTYNGIDVYQGKIKARRGRKEHTFYIHHSKDALQMVVIEGLQEIKFTGSEFKFSVCS